MNNFFRKLGATIIRVSSNIQVWLIDLYEWYNFQVSNLSILIHLYYSWNLNNKSTFHANTHDPKKAKKKVGTKQWKEES